MLLLDFLITPINQEFLKLITDVNRLNVPHEDNLNSRTAVSNASLLPNSSNPTNLIHEYLAPIQFGKDHLPVLRYSIDETDDARQHLDRQLLYKPGNVLHEYPQKASVEIFGSQFLPDGEVT